MKLRIHLGSMNEDVRERLGPNGTREHTMQRRAVEIIVRYQGWAYRHTNAGLLGHETLARCSTERRIAKPMFPRPW